MAALERAPTDPALESAQERDPPGSGEQQPVTREAGRRVGTTRPMVEGIRLIMVALFASAGWEVASAMGRDNTLRATLGIAVGAGIGFVFGGMLGRVTASAASDVERAFRNIPAAELVAGAIGLILGLVPAALLSVPLFHLPPEAALPNVAFVYVLGGLIGSRIARARSDGR